ncbi:PEP/pyruvate-binding domain-containing protein [Nocardia sp. NPDC004123]
MNVTAMSGADVDVPVVLPLAACSPRRAGEIGGKTRGLYSLIDLGLPVPDGFAITAQAYRDAIAATGADASIAEILASADDDEAKSQRIREVFAAMRLPDALAAEITRAYTEIDAPPVAVRSSGIAEDTAAASFAGQHDTYLWVEGADNVCAHVVRCWASLFNAGAIGYRRRFSIPPEDVAMAVVVQRMVAARAAGVMMTLEPVTGDRGLIYIEAAHGLGEGVVVGDVLSDQFWYDKATLELSRSSIKEQTSQHVFDADAGTVVVSTLDPAIGRTPALDPHMGLQLVRLGRDVEDAFECPMDIEWAVSGDGEILLLQARPETVWSNRPAVSPTATVCCDSVTHGDLDPEKFYTTSNIGEAAPGVLTPLTWSVWGPAAEIAARYGFIKLGALESSRSGEPVDPHDRFIQIAYGRALISASAFYEMGERIPGTSGELLVSSFLGEVPEGMRPHPTRRRYPHAVWTMPRAFAETRKLLVAEHADVAAWWPRELARTPHLDLAGARAQFCAARQRFIRATSLQSQANVVAIPPVYQALEKLVADAGMQEHMGAITAGAGDHAEAEVVIDLWDLGRGELSESEFLSRHGFHGTHEGDIAGRVWREDPTPIRRLAALYREQDSKKDPRVAAFQRTHERQAAIAELMSRLGPIGRIKAGVILRLADSRMPLRGIGKATFLRTLDITRAAARRIGQILVAEGLIDDADNVMYLTADELTSPQLPANIGVLIAERKAQHELYRTYELPPAFWGVPEPAAATAKAAVDQLCGVGASAGIVEGIARVVSDPSFAEVEPGEILVASTTDPSWAAVMLISAALVVDIGGALSHAAVVARELGIPCVVNTGIGTTAIVTGDRLRVDGLAGTVDVLERA